MARYDPEYYQNNKEKYSKKAKASYERNKEAYKARAWKNHLWREYHLTEEEYEELWNEQEGRCKICKRALQDGIRKPHIDHDHETGQVRGILCIDCNRGLGGFKDNVNLLQAAIDYLERI